MIGEAGRVRKGSHTGSSAPLAGSAAPRALQVRGARSPGPLASLLHDVVIASVTLRAVGQVLGAPGSGGPGLAQASAPGTDASAPPRFSALCPPHVPLALGMIARVATRDRGGTVEGDGRGAGEAGCLCAQRERAGGLRRQWSVPGHPVGVRRPAPGNSPSVMLDPSSRAAGMHCARTLFDSC